MAAFDLAKMRVKLDQVLAQSDRNRHEQDALYPRFPERETFRLDADCVDAFLAHYAVQSKGYGMIVAGHVVTSERQFRDHAKGQCEIGIELVFEHPDDAHDVWEIRQWFLEHARRG